jgi:hypothetical protein
MALVERRMEQVRDTLPPSCLLCQEGLLIFRCLRLRIQRLKMPIRHSSLLEPIISRFLRYSCMQALWQNERYALSGEDR